MWPRIDFLFVSSEACGLTRDSGVGSFNFAKLIEVGSLVRLNWLTVNPAYAAGPAHGDAVAGL